jgi:hypothetical protein
VRLDLQIVDVASERAFTRPAVFATLEVLMAAEAFRDGRAVAALGWSGDPPLAEERVFPSFRLYVRTIYDVRYRHRAVSASSGGTLTIIAAIEDPPVIAKILNHLGLSAWAPPRSPARSFDRLQMA